MVFKPAQCKSRWEGVFACLWVFIVQVLLVHWLLVRSTDWMRFTLFFLFVASVPLLIYLIYRTWAAFTLEYWVDRNAVTVRWADVRQTIPLDAIRQIIVGGVPETRASIWRYWPAPYLRPARLLGGVKIPLLATRPPSECLLLNAGSAVFAISPASAQGFLDAVQERVHMGPVTVAQMSLSRRLDVQRLLKTDRLGLIMLAAGLLGGVLLFGALMVRYPGLPDVMTVRYSAEGVPEQVRDKAALFLLPFIGMLAWVINGIWGLLMAARDQQTGAHLLWGGAIIVQICSFFALTSLIG